MLELSALGLARQARQDRHALVDLERVGGDCDGVPAETVGQRHGDGRLPDPGRAEDRYDGWWAQPTRASRRSSPASVVLVAEAISTSTSSPGCARPLKLTVLL